MKWTFYRTRKKWDFWISGSYNHEEPGSTESITAGIEVVNDPKCVSTGTNFPGKTAPHLASSIDTL